MLRRTIQLFCPDNDGIIRMWKIHSIVGTITLLAFNFLSFANSMGCTWCHKNELIYKIKLCIKTLRAYSFLEIWKINFFWCISWKIYHWAAFSKIESFSNIQQILWRRVEVFQTSKTFFLETIFFEVFDMISTSPIPLKVAKNLLHTSLYRSGFGFWQIQIHGIFKNLKTWEQWWKNSFSKLTPFHEFFFFW